MLKKSTRKKILYVMLGLVVLAVLTVVGGIQYFKYTWIRETPNTLTIEGDLHPVPFEWSSEQYGDYTEPHNAILIPVSVPGCSNLFHMQFDTGSPFTSLRRSALESLKGRGCKFDLFDKKERTYIRKFELNVAGNRVLLNSGRVFGANVKIDWDEPGAVNVIGTIGSDFIDRIICAIDFPAREIRLYRDRPESLKALGSFAPFEFKGRRVMLPMTIDGAKENLFYDSGCSGFGLLTSKYFFERYSEASEAEINYDANRHGDPVPVHHKSSDMVMQFGNTEIPIQRVSYVNLYQGLQSTLGRFTRLTGFMGVLGNKSLTESTLILDAKANEFLIVSDSLQESDATD